MHHSFFDFVVLMAHLSVNRSSSSAVGGGLRYTLMNSSNRLWSETNHSSSPPPLSPLQIIDTKLPISHPRILYITCNQKGNENLVHNLPRLRLPPSTARAGAVQSSCIFNYCRRLQCECRTPITIRVIQAIIIIIIIILRVGSIITTNSALTLIDCQG